MLAAAQILKQLREPTLDTQTLNDMTQWSFKVITVPVLDRSHDQWRI